jgi:ArsR family transcriptional regulator
VTAGRSSMSPGAIADKLGLPAPTLSFHLKELAHAELIEGKSQGRFIIYCASYYHMQTLMDFLMENCCAAEQCDCASHETEAQVKRFHVHVVVPKLDESVRFYSSRFGTDSRQAAVSESSGAWCAPSRPSPL